MGLMLPSLITVSILLFLLCALQVEMAPVPEEEAATLIQRVKRSMFWRWNTLRPVGSSCWQHAECGTNYCKDHMCSFQL